MSLSQILALEAILEGAYRREEYPATSYQAELWSTGRPLEGLTILDATPVYRNTFAKYRGLMMAGAELIVGLSDVMPCDAKIVDKLKELDIPVVRADDPERATDIILDCAGSFASWSPRIGYVELTRSGVYKYEGKEKPVYLADSGRIKKIETCLGTGESYYRCMKELGYEDWAGKKLVVFGSGKVGTGLVMYARRKGAVVTVVTAHSKLPEHLKPLVENAIDFHDGEALAAANFHSERDFHGGFGGLFGGRVRNFGCLRGVNTVDVAIVVLAARRCEKDCRHNGQDSEKCLFHCCVLLLFTNHLRNRHQVLRRNCSALRLHSAISAVRRD